MIRKVEVEAFLKNLAVGVSKPSVVVADGEKYILKTQKVYEHGQNIQYDCMFLNELLAYQIAVYLNINIPDAAIAYLDRTILDNDPRVAFAYKFQPGDHFASKMLANQESNFVENIEAERAMGKPYIINTWNAFLNKIKNKEDVPKIIAFDLFIANYDRYRNDGNFIIDTTNERKIFAIDHGHAFFGPIWNTVKVGWLSFSQNGEEYIRKSLDLIPINFDGAGNVFRALEQHINLTDIQNHDFLEIVLRIESIDEPMIDVWLENIPDEWFVDKVAQCTFYKLFLLNNKNMVRYLIQCMANRGAFSNYRGGELQWQISKQYGTA